MFDKIVLAVMAVFCVIGGFDRIFGNRLKLGTAFENGIMTMGSLTLSMVGIIVLSPVLAKCLEPVVVPFTACWALIRWIPTSASRQPTRAWLT